MGYAETGKSKDKDRILKIIREKHQFTFKRTISKLPSVREPAEILQVKKGRTDIFRELNEAKAKPKETATTCTGIL